MAVRIRSFLIIAIFSLLAVFGVYVVDTVTTQRLGPNERLVEAAVSWITPPSYRLPVTMAIVYLHNGRNVLESPYLEDISPWEDERVMRVGDHIVITADSSPDRVQKLTVVVIVVRPDSSYVNLPLTCLAPFANYSIRCTGVIPA